MKIDKLKQRLQKGRPSSSLTISASEDVVDDLAKVALHLGFQDFKTLVRAYIGQGLRTDLARIEANPEIVNLVSSLRRQGISEEVIANTIADSRGLLEAA
jgi:uncharacterized LabA/DUF88 family protein